MKKENGGQSNQRSVKQEDKKHQNISISLTPTVALIISDIKCERDKQIAPAER